MNNPYRILGVSHDADDETIRKAWLLKVRSFPPETAPEMFKVISRAYEAIKTEKNRTLRLLFSTECDIESPIEALTSELSSVENRTVPSRNEFTHLISRSFKSTYLKKR